MEQEHYREHEWQQQLSQARQRKAEAGRALLHELRSGSSGSGSGSKGNAGDVGQEEAQQQRQQHQLEWPALGQRWDGAAGSIQSTEEQAADGEQAPGAEPRQGQQEQQAEARLGRPRFAPPALNIITGVGRHSKGGGVLKAAVKQVLQQQGLPARDNPTNEGGQRGCAGMVAHVVAVCGHSPAAWRLL